MEEEVEFVDKEGEAGTELRAGTVAPKRSLFTEPSHKARLSEDDEDVLKRLCPNGKPRKEVMVFIDIKNSLEVAVKEEKHSKGALA